MAGTVRKCEICRKWIEPGRLEALVHTQLCGEHAREMDEKYGGEFITRSREERTSKPGSLKLNIGGVITRMVRNTEGIERLRRDYEEERYGA
jgi:hypothetical protein